MNIWRRDDHIPAIPNTRRVIREKEFLRALGIYRQLSPAFPRSLAALHLLKTMSNRINLLLWHDCIKQTHQISIKGAKRTSNMMGTRWRAKLQDIRSVVGHFKTFRSDLTSAENSKRDF
ncbi:hypothetical protein Nepgr_026710 [Nepenthes gracilis]|uniref:Uncharacterized protein n=1 Tax=Nepenthes gracilis TaxID=150966 RepID=A0AAD3Y0M6_NEPGR|nr:hypothetical protein Nepgr_026710 [Nepenthes gracilis]